MVLGDINERNTSGSAILCIHNFYPPPGPEEEFVFKGFCYADE